MGSGGLLEEFLVLGDLVTGRGRQNIVIDCVDPSLNRNAISKILQFFGKIPNVNVQIHGFDDVETLVQHNPETYHGVMAIDYDDLFSRGFKPLADFCAALSLMKKSGVCALGFNNFDLLFGPEMPIQLLIESSFLNLLAKDIGARLPKQPTLHITFPEAGWRLSAYYLLPLSIALQKSEHQYGQIELRFLKEVDQEDGQKHLLDQYVRLFNVSFVFISLIVSGFLDEIA